MRLLGCFGDSLLRKFGEEPPEEWCAVIRDLSDFQLARGMRRLVASGRTAAPSLPEFRSFCTRMGHDEDAAERPPALGAPDTFAGDAWDIRANRLLLAHITKRLSVAPRCYGPIKPFNFRLQSDGRYENPASPEQAAATAVLVAYKCAWARDMREWEGSPTGEEQRLAWEDCMSRAETEIVAGRRAA